MLEIKDFDLIYRTEKGVMAALRKINLTINRGEVLGLVGESGCGKSSLISSILRLLPENAGVAGGEIRLGGTDMLSLSENEMRRLRGRDISIVFQNPMSALNPVLSIGRQMEDIQFRESVSRAEKRERAAAMLSEVGIPDASRRLRQHIHELSGGMRQRVAIAMALMARPSLLIADEPTTALDATLEVQIIEKLKALQEEIGCSILFITHHLGVVAELCDAVAIMYAGEVVETGSVERIFGAPRHPYTRRLIACDPAHIGDPSRVLPTIPGEVPKLYDLPGGCVFRPRCEVAVDECARTHPDLYEMDAGHHAACIVARGEKS